MKKIVVFCLAILNAFIAFAQAPQKISYQSVIRNSSNALLSNQSVGIRISILQGTASGSTIYTESQISTTNANGLVSLEIGSGIVLSGTFTNIDWNNGPFFIKTETDPNGGNNYTISGTTQILSVPYALHAKTAENVVNDLVDDADSNPVNELQTISFTNDTLYLSNGGSVFLGGYAVDLVNDADADPNNEIELPSNANAGDILEYNGNSWQAASPPPVSNAAGSIMYIYDGQTCPAGWNTQQINVAVFGGVPVDACWTDTPCLVMYIYDGQSCPSGWNLQQINAPVVNGTTTPVDACYKCY